MCGQEPILTTQVVTFTTAAPSAQFSSETRFVRLYASADCRVAFGPDRVATVASMPLTGKVGEYLRGPAAGPGQRLRRTSRA